MSTIDIINKIERLKELKDFAKEVEAEIEALENAIKDEMLRQNTEEMEIGRYIVRYTVVVSNRFDSTAFKKVMPDVYKVYTKPTTSRRFTISG